jgi:hypothetical protein
MVNKYVRMFALSMKETDTSVIPESEGDFSIDDGIALMLSEEPFLSVKKVAMSKSTAYCHLTQTMRWKLGHIRQVPRTLIESEKGIGCKEQQNFWSFYSQSDTEGVNILSPLTNRTYIGRSIGSSSHFQRMMNREQGQDEGLTTTEQC